MRGFGGGLAVGEIVVVKWIEADAGKHRGQGSLKNGVGGELARIQLL